MVSEIIKIAILDDHQIIIDGLKLLLESSNKWKVIFDSTRGSDFISKLKNAPEQPDIVLIDLMMPEISGYEMAVILKNDFPELKIIILSMNIDGKTISELTTKADIKGFLPKSVNKNELLDAIKVVYEDGDYFSTEILDEIEKYNKISKEVERISLTNRELEIIKLINDGFTNKNIADKLFISEQTVNTHRKNILRKTGTHNVSTLINFARNSRII